MCCEAESHQQSASIQTLFCISTLGHPQLAWIDLSISQYVLQYEQHSLWDCHAMSAAQVYIVRAKQG